MRRWLKRVLVSLACLGLMGALILGGSFLVHVPLRPSKVTQANLDWVQRGMTVDEVEEILGPPGNYHSGHYSVRKSGMVFRWYWIGDEGFIIIHFGPEDDRHPFAAPWKVNYAEFFPVPRQTYGERWVQYYSGVFPLATQGFRKFDIFDRYRH
jgi:hypothetical protein